MAYSYVLANHGEYVSYYDKDFIDWTFLPMSAKTFKTYSSAYSAMKTINRRYGYERCYIAKKTEDDII